MDAKREQVNARMAAIETRFADRLTSEQLDAVRKNVEGTLELAAALRAAEVDVSDEPSLYPDGA